MRGIWKDKSQVHPSVRDSMKNGEEDPCQNNCRLRYFSPYFIND